ncbi:MAG: hypothetical protein V4670_10140 [Bacteroidota bacterium]
MKTLFFSIILLLNLNTKAADDEIILKNGNKTTIQPNSFKVDFEEKTISFKSTKNTLMKLKFNEFNSVVVGVNKFQTLKRNSNSETEGYFVLTETTTKKLLIRSQSKEEENEIKYDLIIIDSNNQIIETHTLNSKPNKKSALLRSEIFTIVKYHFSECQKLIERMEVYDKNSYDINNTRILSFFNNPVFYDYTKND